MSKPVVISGEASETDSEDEVVIPINSALGVKGEVVTGEDSESEDENGGSVCSAESAMHQSHTTDNVKNIQYDSLLHQKLRECNIKLHNDIETHCDNCIEEASKTLNVIDQQLLKSQVTLQNAATSLKTLSATSVTLKNKLQSLLSAKFLPNVKVHD
ncbi:biogenesis of lysosome-related organelles complex 1 subunit 3 isoform X2 [Aethina tumida]|uniref:biogenesis of lysosome-related organelles complex 1 subunit 3 isoform X2 n=1 Tax=Aethina tumida TaxID=116153 RepID=UPI00096B317C|nr:biogenesis of lysosome-related organelles complex 1 subunit 3 isoform X2 [Aethina tumida]